MFFFFFSFWASVAQLMHSRDIWYGAECIFPRECKCHLRLYISLPVGHHTSCASTVIYLTFWNSYLGSFCICATWIMSAFSSFTDYLSIDVTLWAQTLWRFARDVSKEVPVPLRFAFHGAALGCVCFRFQHYVIHYRTYNRSWCRKLPASYTTMSWKYYSADQ